MFNPPYRLTLFKYQELLLIYAANTIPRFPFFLFLHLTFMVALGLIKLICYAQGDSGPIYLSR